MFLTEAEFRAAILRYFGLTEALRSDQSHEQVRADLEKALNEWPERPGERGEEMHIGVSWVFDDRLIAYQWNREAMGRRIWEIPWQRSEGEAGATFTFGQPTEVKEVILFEPVTESRRPGSVRMTESIDGAIALAPVQEGKGDGARRIRAIGMTADRVNGNGRRYPRPVLAGAVEHLNKHLHESAGQGRLVATGEVEHPSDKGGRPNLLETVIKWEAASLDASGQVLLEGAILPTSKGKDLATLVEHGVPVGISMRGYGTAKSVAESVDGKRQSVQEVQELWITGWDAVMEPSDTTARIVESKQEEQSDQAPEKVEETKAMNIEELLKLLSEKPELREALLSKLGLTEKAALAETLGVKPDEISKALEEGQKAKVELAQRQAQEAVNAAITEATKGLKYGDALNGLFVESINAAKPETPEAVKAIVEAKRKEYDAIAATGVLAGMGRKGVQVQVLGPVFEKETGRPEFARAAWELNESLVKAGEGHRRNVLKGDSMAEIYTARVLESFDKQHQAKLLAEARMFEEAEQTSDLNLPYSVARMLIEQAYPELIAANVYDFGTTDISQARVYYEAYTGESGSSVTVVDEVVAMSLAGWVQLANKRLRPGTVVLTNSGASTTYTEGTDFIVDYEDGKVLALATITEAQSCKIDYVADAFRKGEMQEIERAKNTLTFATLNMEADRLAMQISREAIVFSRSQLGYDAVTRTLGNLARLVRRSIDKGILYKGLAASLKQASNSGGTWTAASDAESLFVKYLGIAKVKVYNRNYVPTSIVMSQTNADRLSNWDGFKRDGFPNAVMNAAGFAGGIKGLPVFASTEYPDTYAQVVHRELVAHRVYQAMTFQGPFPSYSNGKLVGADQYYAEEFNGSLITVEQKTAHVKIA